ncbi:MAG: hypothetical protein H6719_21340 [Sandaracinaceae bacterium]|nr:hypothetical protein [Sandaracinaceae bacterium]
MLGGLASAEENDGLAFLPVLHALASIDGRPGDLGLFGFCVAMVGGLLDSFGLGMVLDGVFRAYPHLEGNGVRISAGPGGVTGAF